MRCKVFLMVAKVMILALVASPLLFTWPSDSAGEGANVAADEPAIPRPRRSARTLNEVRRICVEEFEGGEGARQLRALFIDQLHKAGLFVVTENPDRADAYVRGFGQDLFYSQRHSLDESGSIRQANSISTGGYTRNRASVAESVSASQSTRMSQDVKSHEVTLTVRIVNYDGDILWSGVSQSDGGKYMRATLDAARKLATSVKESIRQTR